MSKSDFFKPRQTKETSSSSRPGDKRRTKLTAIADATLEALQRRSFTHEHVVYDLSADLQALLDNTSYYSPQSMLSAWSSNAAKASLPPTTAADHSSVSILEMSTLDGARLLHSEAPYSPQSKIGVLNFASATKPGGGFLTGAQAQEESLARASTLYPALTTPTATQFYALHKADRKRGYYSHAMVYAPGVRVFRDDAGAWHAPHAVDVLTSAAVNAGDVRKKAKAADGDLEAEEAQIARVMRERMARLLFLFEQRGVRRLVLGSFGTGVFQNKVDVVAGIWVDLLCADGARFKRSFDRVVFAILGGETVKQFEDVFSERLGPACKA